MDVMRAKFFMKTLYVNCISNLKNVLKAEMLNNEIEKLSSNLENGKSTSDLGKLIRIEHLPGMEFFAETRRKRSESQKL